MRTIVFATDATVAAMRLILAALRRGIVVRRYLAFWLWPLILTDVYAHSSADASPVRAKTVESGDGHAGGIVGADGVAHPIWISAPRPPHGSAWPTRRRSEGHRRRGPLDAAAGEPRVRHADGRTGRQEAPRGRRLDLRAEVRRLPRPDHQGRAASRAPVEEEQGPRRDVSENRGGRPAVEGRPRQPYGIRPAMSRSPLSIAGLNVFNSAMRVFRSAMRRRNRGTIISSERSMLAAWFSDTDDKPVAHS